MTELRSSFSGQYHALLASRLVGLEDLRRRIWEQGHRSGTPIWVSEIDAKDEFAGKTLDYIQVACLRQVRAVPKFICLLDGSFGTTWNEGQISILELELATAAFSKRDIWIFRLAPFDKPDPRIESLLTALEIACPAARISGPLTKHQILANIAWLLEPVGAKPLTLEIGPLVQDLAIKRSPARTFDLAVRDTQFLNGTFAPLYDHLPDKDLIGRLLDQVASETVIPDKLAKLWIAIRHLSMAPFSDQRYEDYLPLWEAALARWASASAWYGLHGHFFLGRLAAVNTATKIRRDLPDSIRRKLGSPAIFAHAGAAASEYYSIAKLVPSRWQRHRLFGKALWHCNAALSENGGPADPSGLLDIRGHVKLQMFNVFGGIADLKTALRIREEQGEDMCRIGQSQVHLGRAYSHLGLYNRAERLLEDGLEKLRRCNSKNREFLTQALRHVSDHERRIGRKREAITRLREAQAIARQDEILGQLEQIEEALRALGEEP
jgi:tetratricopeptide (TPR) repeat protein